MKLYNELSPLAKKKIRILAMISLALICLSAVGFFASRKTYEYPVSGFEESTVEDTAYQTYTDIGLFPGIYKVCVEYESELTEAGYSKAYIPGYPDGLFFTNGEPLYGALGYTEYEMWLYGYTGHLYVDVNKGSNGLTVTSFKIENTGKLFTMTGTALLFVAVLLSFLIIWKDGLEAGLITKEQSAVLFSLIVICFFSSTMYMTGYQYSGIDMTYHLNRIEGIVDGLHAGFFPVRLEPKWVMGHGYAAATMYGNVLLYFPALLRILGFSVLMTQNIYSVFLNIICVAVAYYSFYMIFRDREIGVILSALYVFSIYHTDKLVVLSAIGEVSVLDMMPLVIYGLYQIYTCSEETGVSLRLCAPLIIALSFIVQSHALTTELTAILIAIFCIVFFKYTIKRNILLNLLLSAGTVLLISAWFLVPFLDYFITQNLHFRYYGRNSIQSNSRSIFQLFAHFYIVGRAGEKGLMDKLNIDVEGVGLIFMLFAFVFVISWIAGKYKSERQNSIMLAGKICTVFGLLLLLVSVDIFPWDKIQYLNTVTLALVGMLENTYRFWGWGTALLTVSAGCVMYFAKKRSHRRYKFMVSIVIVCIVTSGMFYMDYLMRDHNALRIYNPASMGRGFISDQEFLVEGTVLEDIEYRYPTVENVDSFDNYTKGDLTASFDVTASDEVSGYVDLPLLQYKQYKAYYQSNEGKWSEGTYFGKNNVVRAKIPAGFSGHVLVRYTEPWYFRMAELISLVAVICILLYWHRMKVENRRSKI